MNYRTKIKLGRINNLSDARFAAAAGLEWVGFTFDTADPQHITPFQAKEMIEWIIGPEKVGAFKGQTVDEINEVVSLLGLDMVQVDTSYTVPELERIMSPIMLKIQSEESAQQDLKGLLDQYDSYADLLLVARKRDSDWHIPTLQSLCQAFPVLLDGPFSKAEIASLVESIHPEGIQLSGSSEDKVGLQDFDELQDLLEALEEY